MMYMYEALHKQFWNFFAPRHCAYCKLFLEHETILCPECTNRILPVVSTQISLTPTMSMKVYAMAQYQEPLQTLIRAKHWSQRVASYQLGTLLWQRSSLLCSTVDYFVPIPLHWTRYAYRGFNQADIIAQILAQNSSKSCVSLLKRTRKTALQVQVPVTQRAQNVKNAFECTQVNPELYYQKNLMLVDDLMTSGATLHEAGKALLELKPASITALVVCRVV